MFIHACATSMETLLSLACLKALVEEPLSKNASVGELARFNCSVSGFLLLWKVDGDSIDEPTAKEKNIKEGSSSLNGVITSTLTIPCNNETNNTQLQCVGFEPGAFVHSNIAVLMVQGKFACLMIFRCVHRSKV